MTLAHRFAELKAKDERALVVFVTGGDPSLEQLPDILKMLEAAGADVIEVGVPFSDPIADGPTIQASSQRALDRGVTPLQVLAKVREAGLSIPVVAMGYLNTALRMGLDTFAKTLKDSGVSGMIVCDLIPEEGADWEAACRENGLDTIYLAAPTSTDARLKALSEHSTGFVYAVSRTGVTGAGSTAGEVGPLVERIRAHTPLPVCVGFGISKPEHVATVCRDADGAVVGSWLVDLLANEWNDGAGAEAIRSKVAALKEATRTRGS